MKPLVVVNPQSGGGRTGRGWPRTAALLRRAGLDFDYALTERPAQAKELAAEAERAGCPLVVAAGGDGTIHEVANGLLERRDGGPPTCRFGLLPLGTGGDFRRTFQIPRDLTEAAHVLVAGRTRRVDAGRVSFTGHSGAAEKCHFVNIADAGIGGDVVTRVNRGLRLPSGELTFAFATAVSLLSWRNQPMRVVIDGAEHQLTAQQVVVANCRYYGGGMCIAPRAMPDDGLLDVVVAGDLGLLENVRLLRPLRRGTHLDGGHPKLLHRTARRVEVEAPRRVRLDVDGEQPGTPPAVFEIVPGALDLIVP
ncbi:MAG: diacylglycerol kinase family lipid kinase [bacterium]|jgi:YegS/Rv2252/BmrU family lipid kinase|nr:diacylglycerol kinase family lipid kinase [bacterium]